MSIFDFSDYIAERTRDFVGREWVFAEIDAWLTDPEGARFFIITGEPGIGKTAIAARLTQISMGEAAPPEGMALEEGFLAAIHFCSARHGGWITPEGFSRALSQQLAKKYPTFAEAVAKGLEIHIEQTAEINLGTMIGAQIENYYAESPEIVFDRLVRQPLHALCAAGKVEGPLVLLVDGLDESLTYRGRVPIIQLLAACWDFPPQVRFLVTARPVPPVLDRFRPFGPFVLHARSADNQRDVQAYLVHRLINSTSLRNVVDGDGQASEALWKVLERSGGNFLVVSKVLDAVQREEMVLDDPEALPTELGDLYFWFLDRLVQRDRAAWRERYRPVLGLLCAAFEPVSGETLALWTGWERKDVFDTLNDLREFIEPLTDSRYRLYHETIVDFLIGDISGSYRIEPGYYHGQIYQYYNTHFYRGNGNWRNCDTYGLSHFPAHLGRSINCLDTSTARLIGILTDFAFFEARVGQVKSDILKTDLESIVNQIEIAEEAPNALLSEMLALVERLATNLEKRNWKKKTNFLAQHVYVLATVLDLNHLRTLALDRLIELHQSYLEVLWVVYDKSLAVLGLTVTPDEQFVVAASHDGSVRLYNSRNGELEHVFYGHKDRVVGVAATHDGRYIISSSCDNTLKVWDLKTNQEVHSLIGHADIVTRVAIAQSDEWVVSASHDKSLRIWDLQTGQETVILTGHDDYVYDVAVTPDDRRVISTSYDHTLKVWDLQTGHVQTLLGHEAPVMGVTLLPDGNHIVSVSQDGICKVWSIVDGHCLQTIPDQGDYTSAIAASSSGQHIFTVAAKDISLKIWDRKMENNSLELRLGFGYIEVCNTIWDITTLSSSNEIFFGDSNGTLFRLRLVLSECHGE